MEINSTVAKGYVMNARNRRHQCEAWTEFLNLMPIGEPITATEIAKKTEWYSCQRVSAALNALKSVGAVIRMEIAIEPYEIEVERRMRYDQYLGQCVPQPPKKITIDKKTVFIRMV